MEPFGRQILWVIGQDYGSEEKKGCYGGGFEDAPRDLVGEYWHRAGEGQEKA